MAAPGGANQIARRVIDDLIEFSGETSVDGYMRFFKSQQISKSCGFINRLREEANITRNLVGQLNALIAEMEAFKDQGELLKLYEGSTDSGDEWLKDCWLRNGMVSFALELVVVFEFKYALVRSALLWIQYGSILNILQGRNELLEKIIGCVVDSGGVPELDPKVSDIWGLFGIA
ncbi:hypothetical protein Tco_0529455 [Tanacetum coccineum]